MQMQQVTQISKWQVTFNYASTFSPVYACINSIHTCLLKASRPIH